MLTNPVTYLYTHQSLRSTAVDILCWALKNVFWEPVQKRSDQPRCRHREGESLPNRPISPSPHRVASLSGSNQGAVAIWEATGMGAMGRRRERRGPKEMPVLPTAVLTLCGVVFCRWSSSSALKKEFIKVTKTAEQTRSLWEVQYMWDGGLANLQSETHPQGKLRLLTWS